MVRDTTNPSRDGLPVGVTYKHWVERDERLGREQTMRRVGKKTAGRLLDGQEWDQFPSSAPESATLLGARPAMEYKTSK